MNYFYIQCPIDFKKIYSYVPIKGVSDEKHSPMRDHFRTKFLSDVDALLSKVEIESTQYLLAIPGIDEILLEEEEVTAPISVNGFLEITRAKDNMSAWFNFYPPLGGGIPINLEMVKLQLLEEDIIRGVDWALLEKAVLDCKTEERPLKDILLAEGIPSIPEIQEHWIICPEILDKQRIVDEKSSFIDLKKDSPFLMVKQNDVVALVHPRQVGCNGMDIKGAPIAFLKIIPIQLQPGKNILRMENVFVSLVEGCFYQNEHEFFVESVLTLNQGVSFKTGHINFPGDVSILGEVSPGFKIIAGGSIFCTHTLDVTEVIAQGDIQVTLGIIGHEGSVLRAEGYIKAKFLTNANVLARGSVVIQTLVMNSRVQSLDKFILGPKGILVGGKIEAQNGVDLFQVGNERGEGSEIVCGVDFSVLDKIKWLKGQNILMEKTLKTIEMETLRNPANQEDLRAAWFKIRDEIKKLNQLSLHLVGTLDRNENAEIHVRGTIFPGNQVEICHMTRRISQPLTRVRFFLDKHKGVIGSAPLG